MTTHAGMTETVPPDSDAKPRERVGLGPSRLTGGAVMVNGALGLVAAFTLAVDKYRILEDPSFQPSCNLNPILSCGSVMVTDQAEAFGFPNPLVGIIAFTAVGVIGVLVAAGQTLPRWVYGGLAVGSLLGTIFVHWLIVQSLYRIGALCPWCMVVWAVTIPIFVWTVALSGRSLGGRAGRIAQTWWSARYLVVLSWYLVVLTLIGVEFWDYWRTLI